MKKIKYLNWIAVSALFLASCSQSPESDTATTSEAREVTSDVSGKTLPVDVSASKVEWIGTKVSGYHSGDVKIKNGQITIQDGTIAGGRFTMDMQGMAVTGPEGSKPESNDKLLGHLKSDDFFDVENHPEAVFEITEVSSTTETITEQDDPRQASIEKYRVVNPTHMVSGNLTIKGITKNIEFPAHITATDNSVEAIAKFNIDRSQWEITYPGKPDDLIRQEIHMGINLRAGTGT